MGRDIEGCKIGSLIDSYNTRRDLEKSDIDYYYSSSVRPGIERVLLTIFKNHFRNKKDINKDDLIKMKTNLSSIHKEGGNITIEQLEDIIDLYLDYYDLGNALYGIEERREIYKTW